MQMLQGAVENEIVVSFSLMKAPLRIQFCSLAINFVWKCFFTVVDHICAALKQRIAGYKTIAERFSF